MQYFLMTLIIFSGITTYALQLFKENLYSNHEPCPQLKLRFEGLEGYFRYGYGPGSRALYFCLTGQTDLSKVQQAEMIFKRELELDHRASADQMYQVAMSKWQQKVTGWISI